MTEFSYGTFTEAQKLEFVNHKAEIEALNEELRLIQVERGGVELAFRVKERDINTEKQRIEAILRKIQTVTIV